MVFFIEHLFEMTRSDDLAGILGGLQVAADGRPMDPAAWTDWLDAVSRARLNSHSDEL
ncbi:hypothetical protein [Ramlibacter albus]|nr:hypothetical protein [Ramlibacter albus]